MIRGKGVLYYYPRHTLTQVFYPITLHHHLKNNKYQLTLFYICISMQFFDLYNTDIKLERYNRSLICISIIYQSRENNKSITEAMNE